MCRRGSTSGLINQPSPQLKERNKQLKKGVILNNTNREDIWEHIEDYKFNHVLDLQPECTYV